METFSVVIPLYALSPDFLVPYDKCVVWARYPCPVCAVFS
jgi:hypothetical protein